jgi:hypothetical protein
VGAKTLDDFMATKRCEREFAETKAHRKADTLWG